MVLSHLNNPALRPSPTAPCSVSSIPVLLSFAHSPSIMFPYFGLNTEQWSPLSNVHPTPTPAPSRYSTLNAPGIRGIVYVSEFWYSLAAFFNYWNADGEMGRLLPPPPPPVLSPKLVIAPVRSLMQQDTQTGICGQGLLKFVWTHLWLHTWVFYWTKRHFCRSVAFQPTQENLCQQHVCVCCLTDESWFHFRL